MTVVIKYLASYKDWGLLVYDKDELNLPTK